MAKARQVLGRGLNALIPVTDPDPQGGVTEIDISRIDPNPFQPRHAFRPEEIAELAASIRENGLLQPVVVRKHGDRFQLLAGERRFRAFGELKRTRIPALIQEAISDTDMLTLALVENLQRENLNEIEEALAFQALLERCDLSHEELSKRVGKSRTAVTNSLRLLKLPESVREKLIERKITMGHARALLALESTEEMETLCGEIIVKGFSVRQLEDLLQSTAGKKPKSARKGRKNATSSVDPNLEKVQEDLRYRLGTQVHMQDKDGKGKIEIEYYTLNDLNRIFDLIMGDSKRD